MIFDSNCQIHCDIYELLSRNYGSIHEGILAYIDLAYAISAADHLIAAERQYWVASTSLAQFKKGQKSTMIELHNCDEIGEFPLSKVPLMYCH